MSQESYLSLTVTGVFAANRLHQSPIGVATHRTNRERWALVLKIAGKTIYSAGGIDYLSDRNHPVLLPRGCSYTWTCRQPGECLILEFDAAETDDHPIPFALSDSTPLIHIFSRIERSLTLAAPTRELECRGKLYEALLFLAKSRHKDYVPREKLHLLTPAMDYLTQHYADPAITNDLLAGLCGISTVYFRKTFESIHGTSPIQYLQTLRIAKAKAILQSDYTTIGQIAESVGYASIYHFSKTFRRVTGMSPTEYAKSETGGRAP
ncbi:MAG: helix-turn-helix transcriptional regulator, partial [Clostridia bacterium]|nr:helix-turn-helix transcriptional regulator [Clostridia bacterium]